jgi:hypothetical protein
MLPLKKVQTQVTELEGNIDHRIGQFANGLHFRIEELAQRIETLETHSPTRGSRANGVGSHCSAEGVPGDEVQQQQETEDL